MGWEGAEEMHGGEKRRRRHILGKPCRKYFRNPGGGYGARGT